MSRNINQIEQKLYEIRKVQDDIITKPATANKCMFLPLPLLLPLTKPNDCYQ